MMTMVEALPDWAATTDQTISLDAAAFARAAALFARMTPADRDAWVASYSAQFCSPSMVIGPASGLYVMLRVAYDLPDALPRHQAKVFSGFVHPSVGADSAVFDVSWPVRINSGTLNIERCRGHLMTARYDALDEARYFAEHFALRPTSLLDSLGERSGPAIA